MAEIPRAVYYPIGPDYLRTMGIPLLRGRFFARPTPPISGLVVVIDSLLARTYFPDRDPLGQSLTIPNWRGPECRRPDCRRLGHVETIWARRLRERKSAELVTSLYQLPDEALPTNFARKSLWSCARRSLPPL